MDARSAALAVATAVEAVAEPSAWNEVAILAGAALGADSASVVFWGRDGNASVRSCPRTDPGLHQRYDLEMHALNYLWQKAAEMPAGSAVNEGLVGGRDHYLRSAIFNEFIRPQGMEGIALLTLTDPEGPVTGIVTLGRRTGREHFEKDWLEDARSIARALAIAIHASNAARRLDHQRETLVQGLLVTGEGRMLSRSAGVSELARSGVLSIASGIVRVPLLPALGAAIRDAARDPRHWPPPVGAVLGPVGTPAGPLVFAVAPGGISAPGAARLTISALSDGDPLRAFARRYGLTRKEAEIAALLGDGKVLPEIARDLGVSLTTARTHLGHLFDKTGTRNQLSLALLVARQGGGKDIA